MKVRMCMHLIVGEVGTREREREREKGGLEVGRSERTRAIWAEVK